MFLDIIFTTERNITERNEINVKELRNRYSQTVSGMPQCKASTGVKRSVLQWEKRADNCYEEHL